MKKKLCLFMTILFILSSFPVNAYAQQIDKDKFENDVDFMKNVVYFVLNKYQYKVDEEDIMNGIYRGFFDTLDEYSVYYTPEQYKSMITDSSGEFIGIGIQIIANDGKVIVLTPLSNSPAIEAGIKPGDIIKYVDDKDITGMTVGEAANLIKGKEGTNVKIVVVRDNKELTFNIVRKKIITSDVEGKILDNNIGYLKATEFNENTVDLVKEQLAEFDKKNVKKIVLDLRNNGGGLLNSAVDMLNLFVTEGPVVYVDYATGKEDVYSSTLKKQKYDIAVLINGGSASATEVFTAAVKYKKEGIVVGTKSYGKGIVQSFFHLKNDSGVKFTTAEYFSVDRTPVHKIGITPNIVVENPKINLEDYPAFSHKKKPTLGSVSLDVLSAEMILDTLDYNVDEPDGVYDQNTYNEIVKFQNDHNLFAYGTIDYSTQDALYNTLVNYKPEDLQLETAVNELLKK